MKDTSAAARKFTDIDTRNCYKYLQDIIGTNVTIVEIGSFLGTNGLILREYFKTVHCVDAWISGYDPNDSASHQNMEDMEREFDLNIKDTDIIKHKGLSINVAKTFENNSLDLVYIDATHTYEGVKSDIEAWLPKLKPTGIIAGHDYETKNAGWDNGGVKRAINESLKVPDKIFGTNWIIKLPIAHLTI